MARTANRSRETVPRSFLLDYERSQAATGARFGWRAILLSLVLPVLFSCGDGDAADDATGNTASSPGSIIENPLLWRAQRGGRELMLFGTLHLPDSRVTNWTASVSQALEWSTAVLTEIPLDPAAMRPISERSALEPGESLEELLGDELHQRLDRFLRARGTSAAQYASRKIWSVSQEVLLLDLSERIRFDPLDRKLYQWGDDNGREVGGVETVAEQIDLFDSLSVIQQQEFLRESLQQLEEAAARGTSYVEELIELYLSGSLERLTAMMEEQISTSHPSLAGFWSELIDGRNGRMADRIEQRFVDEPEQRFFFAVGGAHFPGETGLIAELSRRGFTVERMGAAALEPVEEGAAAGG